MDIEKRVQQALEKVRPYLQDDGGDIVLVDVDVPVVRVKLLGACRHCDIKTTTMKIGVEDLIIKSVPEITKVISVEED